MTSVGNTNTTNRQSKLFKYMRESFRMLLKARDLYIQGMTACSEKIAFGTAMGCPGHQFHTRLPRSYSVNSSKSSNTDELKELIRVASTRSLSNRIDTDLLPRQKGRVRKNSGANKNAMSRSYSVNIGIINEEEACDFGADVKAKAFTSFTRSRSLVAP